MRAPPPSSAPISPPVTSSLPSFPAMQPLHPLLPPEGSEGSACRQWTSGQGIVALGKSLTSRLQLRNSLLPGQDSNPHLPAWPKSPLSSWSPTASPYHQKPTISPGLSCSVSPGPTQPGLSSGDSALRPSPQASLPGQPAPPGSLSSTQASALFSTWGMNSRQLFKAAQQGPGCQTLSFYMWL